MACRFESDPRHQMRGHPMTRSGKSGRDGKAGDLPLHVLEQPAHHLARAGQVLGDLLVGELFAQRARAAGDQDMAGGDDLAARQPTKPP